MALVGILSSAALLIPSAAIMQATATPQATLVRKEDRQTTGVKKQKNLFRDFMGLNVHSVGFKPELYKPVCRLVREYHPMVWAVWSPTGSNRGAEVVLPTLRGKIVRAEQMPLQAGKANPVAFHTEGDKTTLKVGESPVYLWIQTQ